MTGSRRRRGKKKRRVDDRKELSAAERYWHRRYSLFSLFDLGIQMDEESFYSVTPEVLAAHHADRCKEFPVILDACCGVGGNTIQFALRSARVIGVDCDAAKIEMAKANAEIYGVANRIEWVCGDFIALAQAGRFDGMGIDAVFVSPPWGGPSYIHQQRLSLADFPIDVQSFWEASRRITKNVALFLPRNLELQSLKVLKVPLECESNYLNDRCISMTVYAGDLIAKN